MNTLFVKIFVWFFAAALVLVGFSGFVWNATRPGGQDPFAAFGIEATGQSLSAGSAIPVDQLRVMEGPLKWLTEHGFDVVVFAANGAQIVSSSETAAVDLEPLAQESLSQQTALAQASPNGSLFLATPLGQQLVIATVVPPKPRKPSMRAEVLRWSVPILVSLLLCFALARYLSAPVEKFRHATARLAAGDLGARVGPGLGRRRDELTDAGRDFDVMAERIQQLIESERRLLGDISHELRSPLSRLAVATELERKDHAGKPRPMLDRIEQETHRLDQLIGQLLTLSRLRDRRGQRRDEATDVGQLACKVAADTEFEANSQDRSIEVHAGDACIVHGDRELLRSALENLLRNAIRYTAAGTAVEVEVGRTAAGVRLRVRDRGIGVPEHSIPKLFDPFYRVDDSRSRETGGAGLGLAIVAQVAKAHDGKAQARNLPTGGLEIELDLPAGTPPGSEILASIKKS